ncbi:MAG TPA: YfbM family protein [Chloroflexota bacterium]|nr:YfbM family protein [Chloroflexota bacterium]
MIGNLRPASDEEIERLLATPDEITRFLYGGGSAARERVDLGKTWHAIHFALTGSRLGGEPPLNFLVDEGTPVGDVDVGYGPARALSSAQVRELATALAAVDPETLGGRLDAGELDHESIYPGAWGRNGLGTDAVTANYRAMRAMILRLADSGQGLLLYIN